MSSYAMLINGRSVTTPEQDDVINPARGEPFATCPRGNKSHVDDAVNGAISVFHTVISRAARPHAARVRPARSGSSAVSVLPGIHILGPPGRL